MNPGCRECEKSGIDGRGAVLFPGSATAEKNRALHRLGVRVERDDRAMSRATDREIRHARSKGRGALSSGRPIQSDTCCSTPPSNSIIDRWRLDTACIAFVERFPDIYVRREESMR
ncbi:hypothetical protein NPIL_556921 [Nephila pilipes]|uniref:Uncharacterized protein n=1 Tax=Nephila pilipes TaxID=299642 RepID=A0A8X6PEU4_NEPPI|nr:hypothetical protein NPIL_556921 [Nephila pilipes]